MRPGRSLIISERLSLRTHSTKSLIAKVKVFNNTRKNYYSKFIDNNSDKSLRTAGSPKASNCYGDGAFVVVDNDEGRQLIFSKTFCATYSGIEMLEIIKNTKFDSITNVYQIFMDKNLFYAVYCKHKSKPGNITPGTDNETWDGINDQKILKLQKSILNESYKVLPTRRTYIPKKVGVRSLGIPSTQDKLTQYVLKELIETIYEKKFSKNSHGYRPNKSTHTCIKNVKTWYGITWMIEGDIKSYFSTINHSKLIQLVDKVIKDQRIIDLLWKFIKAGYIENIHYNASKAGIPQEGIIWPLLSNIYLHEFDMYIEEYTRSKLLHKTTSIPNPEYIKYKSLIRSKKKENRGLEYKELKKIPSTIKEGERIYYVRYADDWIIGVDGTYNLCVDIKKNIQKWLLNELHLELSEENKITKLKETPVFFLGYEIGDRYNTGQSKHIVVNHVKKRASHARPIIRAPYEKLMDKMYQEGFLEKNTFRINGISKWIHLNHQEIIYRYNWIINGLLNYYSIVDNLQIFHKIIGYILRHSCAKTLGRKYRLTSRKKVFKKFGKNLRFPGTKLELNIPSDFKKSKRIINNIVKPKNDIRTQHLMNGYNL